MPSTPTDPARRVAHSTLRRIAESAARAGGLVARRLFGTRLDVRLKPDRSEVTDADEAAQAAVVAAIRARRSLDAFLTEETLTSLRVARPTNARLCWVIDPIDGTRNFVRGIPLYTCSVAVMLDGTPLAGAVYDPHRDVLYSASITEGLFVGRRPARSRRPCRGAVRRLRPLVAIPSTPSGAVADLVRAGFGRWVCRNLGSTALHLAFVATGGLDAMLTDNARLWDIAAGWVLVAAAGGRMTSPAGRPLFPLDVQAYTNQKLPTLAASASVYEQLRRP